jgi:hypothetical protein
VHRAGWANRVPAIGLVQRVNAARRKAGGSGQHETAHFHACWQSSGHLMPLVENAATAAVLPLSLRVPHVRRLKALVTCQDMSPLQRTAAR